MTTGRQETRSGPAGGAGDLGRDRGRRRLWPCLAAGLALWCLAMWCLALSPGLASAETISDGIDAYRSGDYQRARDIWRPLAEEGDAVDWGMFRFRVLEAPRRGQLLIEMSRLPQREEPT